MPSSGPNSPGTLANDASGGANAWSNPTNAASSNNSYATVTVINAEVSQYLKATNFGFAIPTDAISIYIVVEVEVKSLLGLAVDNEVKIVKAGVIGGVINYNAATGTPIGTSDGYVSYGSSSSDTWEGGLWTGSQVNASDFGVVYEITNADEFSADTVSVDHIRITVTYTDAAGVKHFQTLLGVGS